mmetsp:Transcript_23248/g.68292  ORF Transcript_23248/g.68292 Transcript_23248/m.68292 type:complete len:429 (+) Transcript_23248:80-1366(+)
MSCASKYVSDMFACAGVSVGVARCSPGRGDREGAATPSRPLGTAGGLQPLRRRVSSRLSLRDRLGDEHRIECGAAQQLVAADEEVEPVVAKDVVLADAADLDVVPFGGGERHRVEVRREVVDDCDARRGVEGGVRLVKVDRLLRLDGDRLSVRAQRRDADARARDGQVGQVHDLARLPGHLALLLCVLVVEKLVDVRYHVEGEGVREDLVARAAAVGHRLCPLLELRHAGGASARGGLVRGHDDPPGAELLVQRRERHQRDGGGAVRVCDELGLCAAGGLGVDLWHNQRNAVLVPKGGRVVDHQRAALALRDLFRPLKRKVARDCEEDDVALARGGEGELLDLQRARARLHRLARRPRRREEPQLRHWEAALAQHSDNLLPHGTSHADDADLLRRDVGHHVDGSDLREESAGPRPPRRRATRARSAEL